MPEMQVQLAIDRCQQQQVAQYQGVVAEMRIGYGSFGGCHHFAAQPTHGACCEVSLGLHLMKPALQPLVSH